MALRRGVRSKFLAFALLLAASFVVANLVFNLQNLALAPDTRPDLGGGSTGGDQPTLGISWTVLRTILISFFLVLAALIIGGTLYLKAKGKKVSLPVYELVGGLVILGVFVVLYLSLVNLGGSVEVPEGERERGFPAYPEVTIPELPTSSVAPIGLVFVGIAFGVILGGLLLSQWMSRRRSDLGSEEEALHKARLSAMQSLQDAIYRLEIGEEVQSVVLRCYSEMTKLFRQSGLRYGKDLTARELETLVKERLKLSSTAAVKLRELFEEARYSAHPLSEMYKETAVECLNSVRDSLDVLELSSVSGAIGP